MGQDSGKTQPLEPEKTGKVRCILILSITNFEAFHKSLSFPFIKMVIALLIWEATIWIKSNILSYKYIPVVT
jgi:hypothetical protein